MSACGGERRAGLRPRGGSGRARRAEGALPPSGGARSWLTAAAVPAWAPGRSHAGGNPFSAAASPVGGSRAISAHAQRPPQLLDNARCEAWAVLRPFAQSKNPHWKQSCHSHELPATAARLLPPRPGLPSPPSPQSPTERPPAPRGSKCQAWTGRAPLLVEDPWRMGPRRICRCSNGAVRVGG